MERVYTMRELAEQLKVNPRTLKRRIAEGGLPFVRLGPRSIRFRERDIEAYLEAHVVAKRSAG